MVIVVVEAPQHKAQHGCDDGPHPVTPAPARGSVPNLLGRRTRRVGGDNERRRLVGDGKRPVPQRARIGDEHEHGKVDPVVSDLVEDLGHQECDYAFTSGHHDDSHRVRNDHDAEPLRSPPQVDQLGIGQHDHTTGQVRDDAR